MQKVISISKLLELLKPVRKEKKIGYITGCFDVLHIGHIELFRLAKKHVDILIVAIENDQSIKLSKGVTRPIHNQHTRAEQLAELQSVDYVIRKRKTIGFNDPRAQQYHENFVKRLSPHFIITNSKADTHTESKALQARSCNAELLCLDLNRKSSSTGIIEHVLQHWETL